MPARKVTENESGRISVTLDIEDRVALERLAKKSDRSLAWMVRDAIKVYLASRRETDGGVQ